MISVIPHIPLEVIDGILRNLRVHWTRDLASCALVCRSWKEFTRGHLFHEMSFAFEVPSAIDLIICNLSPTSRMTSSKTLSDLMDFLTLHPQIRTCIRRLTLRRRNPINGALLAHTQTQLTSLLGPDYLPLLRHLSLINVVLIRPFTLTPTLPSIPPLSSLHIHLDRDRHIQAVDLLYLLSLFNSAQHLSLTGSPTITHSNDTIPGIPPALPYRLLEPKVLTLTKLSSYVPLLRMCFPAVIKNLCVFKAGLFDIDIMDDSHVAAMQQLLQDLRFSGGDVALYYTVLDRNDRYRPPDFSFFAPFVRTFILQFSLYEEESDVENSAIWTLVAKILSSLLPCPTSTTSPFYLQTVVLKISGREQPTNWLPDLYDHRDLIKGLELPQTSLRAKRVEDVLLRLLDARCLSGSDNFGDEDGGFFVRFSSHDHMPPFNGRIQSLCRRAFPRLDAMNLIF